MTVCLALLTPSTMRSPRRVENGLGGWGGGGVSHPLSHTNIDKIHASHIILACFSCVTHYIWASAHVTRIPFASLSKDVSQVESEFHTSLPFTVFTLPYLVTNGTFILSCCFFFFYPRSFPLLYQFLPFLLSCYFNEVLLGKFKWEFSWRCSSIKLTCCSRNRSILMPSPANLVNYKFFVVLLTQQISIQLHKFSVKYVNSLLPI